VIENVDKKGEKEILDALVEQGEKSGSGSLIGLAKEAAKWQGNETVTRSQIEKAGLKWSNVSKKFIQNEWAEKKGKTKLTLTGDWFSKLLDIQKTFGSNFSKILPILLKVRKTITFPAEERFKLRKFVGFEAWLELNTCMLQHWLESEVLLPGGPWHGLDISKHPYLNGAPQLNVTFPLGCLEAEKREFLFLASKHFKKLTRLDTKVLSKDGREYAYSEAKKILSASDIKEIKTTESTYQRPKGKRDEIYVNNQKKLHKRIVKMVNDECKKNNSTKDEIFEIVSEIFKTEDYKFITPKTIRNKYYLYRNSF